MAHAYSFHPNIFRDEQFVSASPSARLLMLAIGCLTDSYDEFEWDAKVLKKFSGIDPCFPLLAELESLGMICRVGKKRGKVVFQFGFPRRRIRHWDRIRQIVFLRDNYTCQYCGIHKPDVIHCDHVHPVSKGGNDDLKNLKTACGFCNMSKNAKLLEDWLQ